MTDNQVERTILREIRRRGISIHDMTSLANHGVDPNPEDGYEGNMDRVRPNKFNEDLGCERMKELLAVGKYNAYDPYAPLIVPFQSIFEYWWNRVVERHLVLDEILEDLYDHFTDLMRRPQKEPERINLAMDFERLSLPTDERTEAVAVGG